MQFYLVSVFHPRSSSKIGLSGSISQRVLNCQRTKIAARR
jgi:hypothetical protein